SSTSGRLAAAAWSAHPSPPDWTVDQGVSIVVALLVEGSAELKTTLRVESPAHDSDSEEPVGSDAEGPTVEMPVPSFAVSEADTEGSVEDEGSEDDEYEYEYEEVEEGDDEEAGEDGVEYEYEYEEVDDDEGEDEEPETR
ncbi:MAG: hypothetical protein AAF658_01680, partial [Myxococcota bacterium]